MIKLPPKTSLYDCGRKCFTLLAVLIFFVTFFINARFGRFTPENAASIFYIDGIRSWIIMELVSPLTLINAIIRQTKTLVGSGDLNAVTTHLSTRSKVVVIAYLIHYLNRAIISPLRAPSRSKSHVSVLFSGMFFNVMNGSLMGTYIASEGQEYIDRVPSALWYLGLSMWAVGLVGNIAHDELLMNLRRNAEKKREKSTGEHYAIPRGLLFEYVSFPNYLCEWFEWLGLALAIAPIPSLPSAHNFTWTSITTLPSPNNPFWPSLTPPYIFFILEILLMFPRAYKGHLWYRKKFGDSYPKNRTIVIPYIL